MNPGFLLVWIVLILSILLITEWKPLLAPDFNKKQSLVTAAIIVFTLPLPLWWPNASTAQLQVHASVLILLAVTVVAAYVRSEQWGSRSYLIAAAIIIALTWGLLRKMYNVDPVYHWFGPKWDAPFLAACLSCMFTRSAVIQFSLLAWGSVLGEWLFSMFAATNQHVVIGAWEWWDALALAILFIAIFRLLIAAFSGVINKISAYWLNNRRGGAA